MSGRTPSDPDSADAATTSVGQSARSAAAASETASNARSTDSEIDAAFAAATSEKPPPPPYPSPPRRPAATLVGIAPPVVKQTKPERPLEDQTGPTEPSAAPLVAPAPTSPTQSSKTASYEVPRPVQAFDQEELNTPPDSDAALTLRRGPAPDAAQTRSSEKPFHRRRRPPTLGRVMAVRVRVLGGAAPFWAVLGLLIMPLLAVTALLAVAVSMRHRPAAPAVATAPLATTASSAIEPVASAAPAESGTPPLELSELEGKPAGTLTSDQLLARAAGRREREMSVAKGLRQNIEREPDAIKQKSMLLALRKLTANPVTAPEALGAMATLPGSQGPDLLYEIWIAGPMRPEGELARELLYSSDIRPKASDALSVALDLRAATSCEQAKEALSRAIKAGDRRSLSPINKLVSKRGCGPGKKEDCYACLREGDMIKDAAKAAKRRKSPAPFTVR